MSLRKKLYNLTRKIGLFPIAYRNQELKAKGLYSVGAGTYGEPRIDQYKGSEARVIIGNYTSVGPDVRIIAGGIHPVKTISQYPFRSKFKLPGMYNDGNPYTKGDIIIGSDVWIGTGVIILSGVQIGNGAVIATNSLVTSNVPDFAIVMGSPAVVKGYRFEANHIKALLEIAWWDWEEERIKEIVDKLTSDNIESFIQQFRIT